MGGRRVFHARGKVLGGSSSINGMIFQRGNPMDYERWAADPGMETWDYLHCLPYFKRMETCLAGADDWRGGDGPLVLERGPADEPAVRRVLRGRAAGRLPADRRRQRLPPGGLREVRPQHPPRPAAVGRRGPTCTRCCNRKNLTRRDATRSSTKVVLRGQARRRRRLPAAPAGWQPHARAGEVILCGGAINTPQLLQLSGVGDADAARSARRRRRPRPARRRREPAGPPRGLHPVRVQAAGLDRARACATATGPKIGFEWLFLRKGLGATNHFEGGGFARSNEDVDYPNLMFHFLPIAIRYDGSAPTKGHGYQVHIGPMYADTRGHVQDQVDRPQASTRRCCSTTCRPRPTARSGSRRSGSPATSSTSRRSRRSTTASCRPGPSVETDEEILDWVARGRRDRAAPVVHREDGRLDDHGRDRPRLDAGARHRRAARRRRVGVPVRHQRQHLRPRDDGRREGGRPDPRQHPASAAQMCLTTATATARRSTRPATSRNRK